MPHSVASLRGTIGDEWDPCMVWCSVPNAETVASGGLGKAAIRPALWERARIPWQQVPFEWREGLAPRPDIPVARHPDEILILVAGGAGKHSCWMPSMGSTSMVTRRVPWRPGDPVGVVAAGDPVGAVAVGQLSVTRPVVG